MPPHKVFYRTDLGTKDGVVEVSLKWKKWKSRNCDSGSVYLFLASLPDPK